MRVFGPPLLTKFVVIVFVGIDGDTHIMMVRCVSFFRDIVLSKGKKWVGCPTFITQPRKVLSNIDLPTGAHNFRIVIYWVERY